MAWRRRRSLKDVARKADGRQPFYTMRFEAARRDWEDEVTLDPENALAWTRLGSASFATGALETAKRAYARALQLDPKSKDVAAFMSSHGWK